MSKRILFLIGCIVLFGSNKAVAQFQPPDNVWYADSSYVEWVKQEYITLEQLAGVFAPVLSFSMDEPYFYKKKRKLWHGIKIYDRFQKKSPRIPTNFPFERPIRIRTNHPFKIPSVDTIKTIVYYRLSEITCKENVCNKPSCRAFMRNRNLELSQIQFHHVDKMKLEYFFYYPQEEGLGKHPDDIESVEYHLRIDFIAAKGEEKAHYKIVIEKIIGRAHGLYWYDNVLEASKPIDLVIPVHILVEEGKHATCPDRNADGMYSPGFDVNTKVNDAWGIRDNIRTSTFMGFPYHAWMTKQRGFFSKFQIWPFWSHERFEGRKESPSFYVLRAWNDPSNLNGPTAKENTLRQNEELKKRIDEKEKEYKHWPQEKNSPSCLQKAISALFPGPFWQKTGLSHRYDGDYGLVLVPPTFLIWEIPSIHGWLLPRYILKPGIFKQRISHSLQIYYTPSASRIFGWYASAGIELQSKKEPVFFPEIGLKIAIPAKHNWCLKLLRIFSLWNDLFGIRVGVDFYRLNDIRLAVEIGTGAW